MNIREATKLKKTIRYLESCIEKDKEDIRSFIKLGALLYVTNYSMKDILKPLEKALELDSKNINARFWLAKSLIFRSREFKKAKLHLIEALNVNPNRADCLSLMGSAITYNLKMDFSQGIGYLEKAISLAPDWPALRLKLALLLIELSKLEQAKKEIEVGLGLVKDNYFKSKDLVKDYYGRVIVGQSEMVKDHFTELLNIVQKKLSAGDKASKYWSLTELRNIDVLNLFYKGKISEEDLYDIIDQENIFFHRGFPIGKIDGTLGLTKLEWSVSGMASFEEIAKWRYEGWPDNCMECGEKIDFETKKNWGIRKNPKDTKHTGFVHIECLNEFDKKDWKRVRKEHRAERSKRLKK